MAALWYLLAAGIALVIVGYIIAVLSGGSSGAQIDPRMSDQEIERQLNAEGGNPLGGYVMFVGYIAIFASIVWRLVLIFV